MFTRNYFLNDSVPKLFNFDTSIFYTNLDLFKQGGIIKNKNKDKPKIHIKKSNEGKFTSYCGGKVTDDCIQKAKSSGNTKLIKRAVFAQNVRKWKHAKGGNIHSTTIYPGVIDTNANLDNMKGDYKSRKSFIKKHQLGGNINEELPDNTYVAPYQVALEISQQTPMNTQPVTTTKPVFKNTGNKLYDHTIALYQGFVDKGINPQVALELTNQQIAENGYKSYRGGDGKGFSTPTQYVNHTIGHMQRMFPDSLKANSFNQFFKAQENGKIKYNPNVSIYRNKLLLTRPGVKKRINIWRASNNLSPLTLNNNIEWTTQA